MVTAERATSSRILRIHRHPYGPRVYVGGLRVHHGLTGAVLLACGLLAPAAGRPVVVSLAVLLMVDDAHDFPWSLRDAAAAH
jgi:hypothetical protein